MANLCEAKGVCRTFSTPLFISESNDDRQSNKRLRATASSFDEGDLGKFYRHHNHFHWNIQIKNDIKARCTLNKKNIADLVQCAHYSNID